jgi:hypothetical protein
VKLSRQSLSLNCFLGYVTVAPGPSSASCRSPGLPASSPPAPGSCLRRVAGPLGCGPAGDMKRHSGTAPARRTEMKTAFSHGKPLPQDFCLPARGFSLTAAFPMQRCDLTQRVEHGAIAHQIGLCPESWDAGLRGRRRPPEKLAAGRCSFPKDAATGWNKPAGGEAWLRGAGTPLTCSTPPLQASPRRTTQSTRLDVVAGGNGARSPVEHGAGSRDVSFPADLSPWLLRTGDAGNESHVGCEPGAGAADWASVGPWAETRRAEHVVSGLHGKRQGAPH